MANAFFNPPTPSNEPVKSYAPGTPERAEVKAELKRQRHHVADIPLVIGGQHLRGRATEAVVSPHNHHLTLAQVQQATADDVQAAIKAATAAQKEWSRMPWED